jgi:DNA-binding NarL/FixJ family response regulator
MSATLRPGIAERVVLTRHGASAIVIERELGLSAIQLRCLHLAALGLSNDAIGKALCLTTSTIKDHLWRTYRQIGCHGNHHRSRIKAVGWYHAHVLGAR